MGYGVIGNTSISGVEILGSNPGIPAKKAPERMSLRGFPYGYAGCVLMRLRIALSDTPSILPALLYPCSATSAVRSVVGSQVIFSRSGLGRAAVLSHPLWAQFQILRHTDSTISTCPPLPQIPSCIRISLENGNSDRGSKGFLGGDHCVHHSCVSRVSMILLPFHSSPKPHSTHSYSKPWSRTSRFLMFALLLYVLFSQNTSSSGIEANRPKSAR